MWAWSAIQSINSQKASGLPGDKNDVRHAALGKSASKTTCQQKRMIPAKRAESEKTTKVRDECYRIGTWSAIHLGLMHLQQ